MTRLRVLLLTPACQGADGLSAYARLCIDALAGAAELEVWSLAERDDHERPLPEVVKAFFAGGSKRRLLFQGLKRALRPPDLIFCTHLNITPVAFPMSLAGARLVVSLLGIEAWRPLRFREWLSAKRAERFIAISKHTAERFREANPSWGKAPVEVCHLCLPQGPTADVGGSRSINPPYKENRPDNEEEPFALIVARMAAEERYKGHDLLLEIWPEVRKQVANGRLVIVGDGDDRPRLEAKRDALGLQESVSFLGRVADEELTRLYADCAFFVMPSRYEGFGLVFLEAMRAGKACIGAHGSAAEIVEYEKTGFVFDADDRVEILEACIRLIKQPELAARLGDAGRRREAEVFSFTAFRRRLLELLRVTS